MNDLALATVLIADVGHHIDGGMLDQLKRMMTAFLQKKIEKKIEGSSKDIIGILLAGTTGTQNRLYSSHKSQSDRYKHLSVLQPVMSPTAEYFDSISNLSVETGSVDFLDAILCATDMLLEVTNGKKHRRRIYLISDVSDRVKHKEELPHIIQALNDNAVQLVVVGLGFTEDPNQSALWDSLTDKQQNERVLDYVCKNLSNSSVYPVAGAIEALESLTKKEFAQRPMAKTVLSIGAMKIPVHLYNKTYAQKMPIFDPVNKDGLKYEKETQYINATTLGTVAHKDIIKGHRYGGSIIPFAPEDQKQLAFASESSLQVLGFVHSGHIPFYLCTGGVKAITAVPDDKPGYTALLALIRAMTLLERLMLVRYVFRANAAPQLCVCKASLKKERQILYMATLPYAEDVRFHVFPTNEEVAVTNEQETALRKLIDGMTLDDDELRPKDVFNPSLQQFKAWMFARYCSKMPAAPLPGPDAEMIRTSMRWGEPGNVLHDMMQSVQQDLAKVAALFPFTETATQHAHWLKDPAIDRPVVDGEPPAKKQKLDHDDSPNANKNNSYDTQSSTTNFTITPTTATNTTNNKNNNSNINNNNNNNSNNNGNTDDDFTLQFLQRATPQTKIKAHIAVSTSNPVASFQSLLAADAPVLQVLSKMIEFIMMLFKVRLDSVHYDKIRACMCALRNACTENDEPGLYLRFLENLHGTLIGDDVHETFWYQFVAAGPGRTNLLPISSDECASSHLTPEAARCYFDTNKNDVYVPEEESFNDDDDDLE